MREISPASGLSVDQYPALMPPDLREIVSEIRRKKLTGERPTPSTSLLDKSQLLTKDRRIALLDEVAKLTDENYIGRSEMCTQFADLLNKALSELGFPARAVLGKAIYYDEKGNEIFRWDHAWVRIGDEVVDGNVDSIPENIMVPNTVRARPYWGPINETPQDRKLQEKRGESFSRDEDVEQIWWPELGVFVESLG